MGSKEEHGTSRAGAAAFQRQLMRLGEAIYRFESLHEIMFDNEGYIKKLSIMPVSPIRGQFMMVVTGFLHGEHVVCFQQGSSLDDCLLSFINRWANGSLKWREDEYAKND